MAAPAPSDLPFYDRTERGDILQLAHRWIRYAAQTGDPMKAMCGMLRDMEQIDRDWKEWKRISEITRKAMSTASHAREQRKRTSGKVSHESA